MIGLLIRFVIYIGIGFFTHIMTKNICGILCERKIMKFHQSIDEFLDDEQYESNRMNQYQCDMIRFDFKIIQVSINVAMDLGLLMLLLHRIVLVFGEVV